MKVLFALLFTIILFCQCTKQSDVVATTAKQGSLLLGNWQWHDSKGGWGAEYYPDSNTTISLSFINDSAYAIQLNNQLQYSGHYTTNSLQPGNTTLVTFDTNIVVNSLRLLKQEGTLLLKKDTLVFYDYNIVDGYIHSFIKN